jgi:hypothetical protein
MMIMMMIIRKMMMMIKEENKENPNKWIKIQLKMNNNKLQINVKINRNQIQKHNYHLKQLNLLHNIKHQIINLNNNNYY